MSRFLVAFLVAALLAVSSGCALRTNMDELVEGRSSIATRFYQISASASVVEVGSYLHAAHGNLRLALSEAAKHNQNATIFRLPRGSFKWDGTFNDAAGFRDHMTIEGYGVDKTQLYHDLNGTLTGQINFFARAVAVHNHYRGIRMSLLNVNSSYFSAAISHKVNNFYCSVSDCEFDSTYVPHMWRGTIRWGIYMGGSNHTLVQRIKMTRGEIIVCGDGRGGHNTLVQDLEVHEADDFAVTCVGTTNHSSISNITFQNIQITNISGCGGFFIGTDGKPRQATASMKDVTLQNITISGYRTNHFTTHLFGQGIKIQAAAVNENIVVRDVKMSLADNPDPRANGIQVIPHSGFVSWNGLHISNVEIGEMSTGKKPMGILVEAGGIINNLTIENVVATTHSMQLKGIAHSVLNNVSCLDGALSVQTQEDTTHLTISNSRFTLVSSPPDSPWAAVKFGSTHGSFYHLNISNTTFYAPVTPLSTDLPKGASMHMSLVDCLNTGGHAMTKETKRGIVYQHGNTGFGHL